jgi:adenine-specific DNA-methyltransferase
MTELIWDGKYKNGKKQGPVRIALPFQPIETVNESVQERQRSLELFSTGLESAWRNRLIWGDKKYVLPSLVPEFAGRVNLIYIDPPFDTGQDFSFVATIPRHPNAPEDDTTSFTKEPSILEQKAYRDTWGVSPEERERGVSSLDRYLKWFYETVLVLRELLTDNGVIYVHLDQSVIHYVKPVMDEVFGPDSFLNHIIWSYRRWPSTATNYQTMHDDILLYVKDPSVPRIFNIQYEPPSESYLKRFKGKTQILDPETKTRKLVVDEPTKGLPLRDVWDISIVAGFKAERTDYPTQKPEPLLERIISVSSNEGDLVLDCFTGSGTTVTVSEKMNRRWIACDLSRFAIHTTRKRLLAISNLKPFIVQNLGKYERQAWQMAEFPANGKDHVDEQRQREVAYRRFILDLYRSSPLTGNAWLHGTKSGRMVHVGAVDAPVTLADVKSIAKEAWKTLASGKDTVTKAAVDILGWEFSFELNELAKQVAAESRVDVAFKKIPREVLDKRAVQQGDVRFFELGALSVDTKQNGGELIIKLKDFLIPTDDIPEEARKSIKHWSQLIDYWAVDWDYKNDTFHNQWQTYRTRKDLTLELYANFKYSESGKYTIAVKVIDILGNDTTKTLEVTVKDKK